MSSTVIGFVLGQHDEKGQERVISYRGCALRGAESKWSICEQECLALVETVKQFHPYLSNAHFTVYTDNLGAKYLKSIKDATGRVERWSLKLQGYDFDIVHKPGTKNQNADALLR